MGHPPSSLAFAVDAVLRDHDTDLKSWLAERVEAGKPLRDLAFEIRTDTGIPISHETLRRWIEHYSITSPAGAA